MRHSPLRHKDDPRNRKGSTAHVGSTQKESDRKNASKSSAEIDVDKFILENFQPEDFLSSQRFETQDQIQSFHNKLGNLKHIIGGDLKRKVNSNYTEFVTISKEISNLDSDVLRLQELLNELRVVWERLKLEGNQSSAPIKKPNGLEHVEGAENFINADHCVIYSCANVNELDSKGRKGRLVHIFVLNDSLLIATQRHESNKYRLVADQCLSLNDVSVMEFKDILNGFKIVKYPVTSIYRCERPEERRTLLDNCRRIQINLSKAISGVSDVGSTDQWLTSLPDELEVKIALRKFEEAVVDIEKARIVINPSDDRTMTAQLQNYIELLSTTIVEDLDNTLLTKLQFQRNVNWLVRLGKDEEARDVFLLTRSRIIKTRIRQLVFEGDITRYIDELALVVFTLIRNTCEWYRDSFKNHDMASGFVTWVREQADIYADIFKRQVFSQSQLSCDVIAECYNLTFARCKMLRKVGLDLKCLIADLFLENVKETVIAYRQRIRVKVERYTREDGFEYDHSQNLGEFKVTSSVVGFYNLLIKFVNSVCLIPEPQLCVTIASSVEDLTKYYLKIMVKSAKEKSLKEQRLASANMEFVLDNIVPRVSAQLSHTFDRPIPELDTLRTKMRTEYQTE